MRACGLSLPLPLTIVGACSPDFAASAFCAIAPQSRHIAPTGDVARIGI